jgi:hypothetical protein
VDAFAVMIGGCGPDVSSREPRLLIAGDPLPVRLSRSRTKGRVAMSARAMPCGGVAEGTQLSLTGAQSYLASAEDALNGWYARRTADGRTYVADGHEAIRFIDQLLGELHRVRSALIGEIRADEDERAAAWTGCSPGSAPTARLPRRPSTTRGRRWGMTGAVVVAAPGQAARTAASTAPGGMVAGVQTEMPSCLPAQTYSTATCGMPCASRRHTEG